MGIISLAPTGLLAQGVQEYFVPSRHVLFQPGTAGFACVQGQESVDFVTHQLNHYRPRPVGFSPATSAKAD
jgi:hypothetical protein